MNIEQQLEKLDIKPGDIIVAKGFSRGEFRNLAQSLMAGGWHDRYKDNFLILLPDYGALESWSWDRLQKWQEERLKDD